MSRYCPVCGFKDLPITELGCGTVCPACLQGVVADPYPPVPRPTQTKAPVKHRHDSRPWAWKLFLLIAVFTLCVYLRPSHSRMSSSEQQQQLDRVQREREANLQWHSHLAGLDQATQDRMEKLRAFRDEHWASKDKDLLWRAVQADWLIRQIVSNSKWPDPRYSIASMEWDLKEIDSEREQLERSMTPYDSVRSEQYLYGDPYLKTIRDRKSQQLQDLRQKEALLKQQLEREHRLERIGPIERIFAEMESTR
jgi:hypothetical protein